MRIANAAKALWASVSAFWLLIFLWVLRQFSIVGSEFDLLVDCVSAVSLVTLGVFVGVLISEKKVRIRSTLTFFVIFVVGFLAAPFVAVGLLLLATNLSFSKGMEPFLLGGGITGYLLLYMLFWFWLKRRGLVPLGETS